MSAAFTPGPWQWTSKTFLAAIAARKAVLSRTDTTPTSDADAHLIAAAPELYAALLVTEALLSGRPKDPDSTVATLEIVRAALAKARGET